MTQTVKIGSLRPLLFEYEPTRLAKLTGLDKTAIDDARASAEMDLLFRLAFSDTNVPLSALPRPTTATTPISDVPTIDGVLRLPGGAYEGTLTPTRDLTIEADGDVTWWSGAHGCLAVPAGVSVSLRGVRLNTDHVAPLITTQGTLQATDLQLRVSSGVGILVVDGGSLSLSSSLIEGGRDGVAVRDGDATLVQVRLHNQRRNAIVISVGARAALTAVTCQQVGCGLRARGTAVLDRLRVLGALQDGIVVGAGGRLEGGSGSEVRRCQGDGVRILGQGVAVLSGVQISDNQGAGVLLLSTARAELHNVESLQPTGVLVDAGASLMHRACALADIVALRGASVRQRHDVLSDEVTVDPRGGADCERISDALDRVAFGGIIRLRPGHYDESISLDMDVRFVGEGGPGDVCWQAGASALSALRCAVQVDNVTFRGKANQTARDTVWLRTAQGTFLRCRFESAGLSAVVVDERSTLSASDCAFSGMGQGGVVVREASQATIERCSFRTSRMAAIHVRINSEATVRDCWLSSSRQGGVLVYESSRLLMERSEVRSCALASIEVREESQATLRQVRIVNGEQAGIYVHHRARVEATMCDVVAPGRRLRPGVEVLHGGHLSLSSSRISGFDASVRARNRGVIEASGCDLSGNRRLQDKDRTGRVQLTSCRRGRTVIPINVLLIDLDEPGAIWAVPGDGRSADLRGAFLAGEDLSEWSLTNANLDGAFLAGADLRRADLSRARLDGAFLYGAQLDEADLQNASVEGAFLRRASMLDAESTGMSP